MLKSVDALQGFTVQATDGDIGSIDDVYFDEAHWTLRYWVVNTGNWLTGRRVLISPIALREVDWSNQQIRVSLSREQVQHSPDIDTHKPVSRQHEADLLKYYNWPQYWIGPGPWGGSVYPYLLANVPGGADAHDEDTPSADRFLRSVSEVTGYHIRARDDEVGVLADFLFEEQTYKINYIVVETGSWLRGRKVVISPSWVEAVSWPEKEVRVNLKRETIENSPEFEAMRAQVEEQQPEV